MMSTFALISGGTIIQIAPETFPVAAPIVWTPDISGVTPAPQTGWAATETGGAWTFAAPPALAAPTVALAAQAALNAMDAPGGCAIRCFKAGVAFPATWQTYCTELRAIVNGTASPMPTVLPTQPAWPAGT
jgi:hypothetical protein